MNHIGPKELSQYTDKQLQNIHGRIHSYYKQFIEEGKDFNKEDLVNQLVFVLQEMRSRDMKHKVRDDLDREALGILNGTVVNKSRFPCWLACFPKEPEFIQELQSILNIEPNFEVDDRRLHMTIACFDNLNNIEEIKNSIIAMDIKGFDFTVTGIGRLGDAVVIYGDVPGEIKNKVLAIRDEYDCTSHKFEFNPHISLSCDFIPSDKKIEELGSVLCSTPIKMSKPVLMVSLNKGIFSTLPDDNDVVENSIDISKRLYKVLDEDFDEYIHSIDDLVVVDNIASVSGSSVDPDNDNPNDIDIVWRMDWNDDGFAEIDLRNFLMKFDRAFPKEVHNRFSHISSPSGPNWNFIGLADLVLRFKFEPKIIDESYAYYKAMADVSGHGQEWIGIDWLNDKSLFTDKLYKYAAENGIYVDDNIANLLWKFIKDSIFTKQAKGKEVKLLDPFTPLKSRAGYHKNEFFVGEEDLVWKTWASSYV